jgi:heme-degrading monooxygenase HmoA
MAVKVMIKRKLKIVDPEELLPLLADLQKHAQEQPGYISSTTLRSLEDPEDFVVMSSWETAEDWKTWFSSKLRRDIQGRVDSLIGERTFYEIFEEYVR